MKRSRFLAELDEPRPEPYDTVEIEEPLPAEFELVPGRASARAPGELEARGGAGARTLPAPKGARNPRPRAKGPSGGPGGEWKATSRPRRKRKAPKGRKKPGGKAGKAGKTRARKTKK
jgi:hypothetical protein